MVPVVARATACQARRVCGRITLTIPDALALASALGVEPHEIPADYRPRYNIAPGQFHIVGLGGSPRIRSARWGLVPHWAKDETIARHTVNARAETVARKPAFRGAFRKRRCVVVTDGFYEWHGPKGHRTPFWIHPAGGGLLLLAGLYEPWSQPAGDPLWTFTVITCPAVAGIAEVHHRMPVMLDADDATRWTDPTTTDPKALESLLAPAVPTDLELRPVSRLVNDVRNDDPRLVEPTGPVRTVRRHSASRTAAPASGFEAP
ncbi:MAG: SOS response-associated peptidase [Deltaproteobacteria bacterium]|nr:MAG: SOS response-associated peptidase [Deltaproteobacteria bacterium]